MSKALVFAVAFLCLFAVTIVMPFFPPGEIIRGFVVITGVPPFLGISGATIASGVINGLSWGVIVLVIYALASSPKKRALAPIRTSIYPTVTPQTPAPVTKSVNVSRKPQERKQPIPVRKRKTYIALDQDVETIGGIGPTYGSKLRSSDIQIYRRPVESWLYQE